MAMALHTIATRLEQGGSGGPSSRPPDATLEREFDLLCRLQTTLDPSQLLEVFGSALAAVVDFDGLTYVHDDPCLDYCLGAPAAHSCEYRLTLGDEYLGELTVHRSRRFTRAEAVVVEKLLGSLLYPLRNALLYRNALARAQRDGLTGVYNRAAMDETLEREVQFAQRHHSPLALIVLDIDLFKSINDQYGHAQGDCTIKCIADCATECVRRTDMVFRYGGEEFVILLRNTGREGANLLAERIRNQVEALRCNCGEHSIGTTISAGVAQCAADDTAAKLFARADRALYQAKQDGRNRVRAL
ncbi:MAG: GGDEF domain-containing protein [Gammaproteobacteria bacterium]